MAPIVKALEEDLFFDSRLCVSAQHREMLDQILELFELQPDHDLDIMKEGQDLYDITSKVLLGMRSVLQQEQPDMILVHGDTSTCLATSLAGFYAQIPVAHVEAGLRTGNLSAPFPEEANRLITSRLASFHFAPTEQARQNLLAEGIHSESIEVTGNSVIDALLWVRGKMEKQEEWGQTFGSATEIILTRRPFVLITGHRRENLGKGFLNICHAISTLASRHPEVHFIYPVHLNPKVQEPAYSILGNQGNIHLIAPLDYAPFIFAMDRCAFILTDSGGVQEEGPALGKHVLLMRDITERPEAVAAGTVTLVGTNTHKILVAAEQLLACHCKQPQPPALQEKATQVVTKTPYGDGNTATTICQTLRRLAPENTPRHHNPTG